MKHREAFFVEFGLVILTMVLYWPVTRYGFVVFDDNLYATENPWVAGGLSQANLKWAFTTNYASNWHPVTWISHMLDFSVYGGFAGGHHLTNIILHTLNTLLLFVLLRRLTKSLWPSAVVAALFAWHPLHVESVAWIAERKDVLSTFFFLLTLLAYANYVECAGPKRWFLYILSLIFFALGLMSKAMLVTLPFVLLLIDYWPLNRFSGFNSPYSTIQQLVREKLPFFALSMGLCVATLIAQKTGGAVKSVQEVPGYLRAVNALSAYASYIFKTIWPVRLAVFYPLPARPPAIAAAVSLLLIACVSWLACRFRRKCPWIIVGWFWFLGTLVPVIGLVQVGNQSMADRYTYIPSIGLFFAGVWSIHHYFGRWNWGGAQPLGCNSDRPIGTAVSSEVHLWNAGRVIESVIAVACLVACLALARHQLGYWHDSVSLFTRTISVTENNYFAQNLLGVAFSDAGKSEQAIEHYRETVRLNPGFSPGHYNLGVELASQGKAEEAYLHFLEVLKTNPRSEKLHNNLGVILAQQGQLEKAVDHFKQAIELNSEYPKPYLNNAMALQRLGQVGQAFTNYSKALELEPGWPEALDKLAFLLASCPDPQRRNPIAAVELALRANRLTRYENGAYTATLAEAYAAAGQYSNAIFAAESARKQAVMGGVRSLVDKLDHDLEYIESKNARRLIGKRRPLSAKLLRPEIRIWSPLGVAVSSGSYSDPIL